MRAFICILCFVITALKHISDKTFKVSANKYAIFFFFSFQILNTQANAQVGQLRFKHYTTAEGLSQGDVYHITQDSRGFMWFGTFDGLNRFDGYNFKAFRPDYNDTNSIKGERIRSIIEDKNGMIWVGTNEALNRYDFKTNRFKHFYVQDSSHQQLNVTYNPFFIDDKNELWFGYNIYNLGSLNLLSGKITIYPFACGAMQDFIAPDYPAKKFYRHLSNIYTVHKDGLHIIDLDHKQVHFYFSSNPKNQCKKQTLIMGALEDKYHTLWLGSANGLMAFTPSTNQTILYNSYQTKKITNLLFLAQDKYNNIWCGGATGLFMFNTNTKKFTRNYVNDPGDPESIGQNIITSVFIDKDNNIWAGVDPQGIDQINPFYAQLNYIKPKPQANSSTFATSVWTVSEIDTNNILICTNHRDLGIYNKTTSENSLFYLPGEFKESDINNIMADSRKGIWIASEKGLLYSNDKLKTFKIVQKRNLSVFALALFEFNSRILIGSFNGLFSVPMDKQKSVADTIHLLDGKQINCINTSPNGLLCVATGDDEFFLLRVNNMQATLLKKKSFNFLIKSIIFQNENIVWFGTGSGLVCYNILKDSLKIFTEKDGLANNFIYCLLKGNDGNLWMSTNHGISKFDLTMQRFTNYGIAEGAQALEFNTHSFYQSSSGTIYFGGVNGFNYFNPSTIKDFSFAPAVQLLDVNINGTSIPLAKFIDDKEPVKFKSNENNISIEFAALDFNRNSNINYLYKLHDKDAWTSISNRRTLNFANLSSGDYNIEIEAQCSYNETSPHILKLAFIVLPPFYETWWFATIICIVFILIIYSMYRYRFNQLKKLYEMRAKISRDLHDDIGSTLGSISIYSEVAKNRSEKNENAEEAIAKIGSASRELIDKMSDIVWSINPNNESFEQLLNRIKVFAAVMLTPHEILYSIDADGHVKNLRLTTEKRKNIYLIYKESIHNIIKYAECSQVEIKLFSDAGNFIMTIKDNGKGFDVNKLQQQSDSLGCNGIKNMIARAENIQANLNIFSVKNVRTTIELKFKV
ncbi:MAG: two-component regulator propeller domain-containing protein [Parafilimonas sp.]